MLTQTCLLKDHFISVYVYPYNQTCLKGPSVLFMLLLTERYWRNLWNVSAGCTDCWQWLLNQVPSSSKTDWAYSTSAYCVGSDPCYKEPFCVKKYMMFSDYTEPYKPVCLPILNYKQYFDGFCCWILLYRFLPITTVFIQNKHMRELNGQLSYWPVYLLLLNAVHCICSIK
jgi:hypothetical protein